MTRQSGPSVCCESHVGQECPTYMIFPPTERRANSRPVAPPTGILLTNLSDLQQIEISRELRFRIRSLPGSEEWIPGLASDQSFQKLSNELCINMLSGNSELRVVAKVDERARQIF